MARKKADATVVEAEPVASPVEKITAIKGGKLVAHPLDPISYRQAQIEAATGTTITLRRIDDPWGEGAPTYWHGYANSDNQFRPGSRTNASVESEHAMECLDRLAAELGMVEADEAKIERAA